MFKKIPHTYVIIFSIILLAAILTWIIPGGEFERQTVVNNGVERTVIDKDSFHYIERNVQTWQVFSALFNGFVRQSGIIILILMIGGGFWIMNASKSIDVGILSFLQFTKRLEHYRFFKTLGVNNIIIVLVMVLFSMFGAIFGMSEETIAFVIIGTTFLTYLFNVFALTELKASTVSAFVYAQPVIGILFALMTGKDSLTLIKVAATLLVLTGVYLVSKKPKPGLSSG